MAHIFCTNCGSKNENDASFCYKCGNKITVPSAEGTTVSEPIVSASAPLHGLHVQKVVPTSAQTITPQQVLQADSGTVCRYPDPIAINTQSTIVQWCLGTNPTGPDTTSTKKRVCAVVLTLIGCILFIIGFIFNVLSVDGNEVTFTCRFNELEIQCGDDIECANSAMPTGSWNDLCDDYIDVGVDISPDFCFTQSMIEVYVTCIIGAIVFALISVMYMQTCYEVKECICKTDPVYCTYGLRSLLLFASVLCIVLALILWNVTESYCSGNNELRCPSTDDDPSQNQLRCPFGWGITIIIHCVGAGAIFIACCVGNPGEWKLARRRRYRGW